MEAGLQAVSVKEPKPSMVAKAARLGDTLFSVEQLNSYPEEANNDFGLYWFEDPLLNTTNWI